MIEKQNVHYHRSPGEAIDVRYAISPPLKCLRTKPHVSQYNVMYVLVVPLCHMLEHVPPQPYR